MIWWSDLSGLATVVVGKKLVPDRRMRWKWFLTFTAGNLHPLTGEGGLCWWLERIWDQCCRCCYWSRCKTGLFYFYFFVAAVEGWSLQWLLIKSQASAVCLCPTFLLWQVAVPINKCMYSVLYDGAEISWCIQPLFLVKAEMWKWIPLKNRQRYKTL